MPDEKTEEQKREELRRSQDKRTEQQKARERGVTRPHPGTLPPEPVDHRVAEPEVPYLPGDPDDPPKKNPAADQK